MGDQEADALVAEFGEGWGAGDLRGVEPEDGEEGDEEGEGCEVGMHCVVTEKKERREDASAGRKYRTAVDDCTKWSIQERGSIVRTIPREVTARRPHAKRGASCLAARQPPLVSLIPVPAATQVVLEAQLKTKLTILPPAAAMAHGSTPKNRKERRAQANTTPPVSTSIALSQPNRSPPLGKTLYEIAAERQSLLQPFSPSTSTTSSPSSSFPSRTTTHTKINPNGTLSTPTPTPTPSSQNPKHNNDDNDNDPIGALGQAIFLATTLTMLHFTLDVLVHHQYRQEIAWGEICRGGVGVGPGMFLSLLKG